MCDCLSISCVRAAVPVYRLENEIVPDLVSFVPYYVPSEKKYVGWVDCFDIASLMLNKGLTAKAGGVLAVLRSLVRDPAHSSLAAVNVSNNDPFWAIPAERTLMQVCTRACCGICKGMSCYQSMAWLSCCSSCVCVCVCVLSRAGYSCPWQLQSAPVGRC